MGQGSGDEIDVYQSLWPLRPQAKKIAGFIPFFPGRKKPLTLALSRRERGRIDGVLETACGLLPLPPGEGWGEVR